MIDLTRAKSALDEASAIIDQINGQDHDDSKSIGGDDNRKARERKAQMNRDLLLVADRLELAAQLVRSEYWFAKGEADVLNPERDA